MTAPTVHNSANALLTNLNHDLDLDGRETGPVSAEAIPLDLGAIVGEVEALLGPRARDKGIELGSYVAPALTQPLIGDPNGLRRILTALVGNAVKFTDKGQVVIEATAEPESAGRRLVRLTVVDTGIGMPRQSLATLFTPAAPGDGAAPRGQGETGLGLAACHQVAALMGGRISVDSEVGRGSRFMVTLPMATGGLAKPLPAVTKGGRALVVSRSGLSRRLLSRTLGDFGLAVRTETQPEMALQALIDAHRQGREICLVVIDGAIQGADGVPLAAAVRRHPRFESVALLGLEEPGAAGEAQAQGRAETLHKPLRIGSLIGSLERLFSSEGPVRRPAAETPRAARPPIPAGAPRILLAEDNAINQLYAESLLASAGYRVDVARDGVEAVRMVQESTYALVLMDIQMPNLDGIDATARIRSLGAPFTDLPILAMTAHATSEARARSLAAGMNDHITKPIQRLDLLEKIARWMAMPQPASAAVASDIDEEQLAELESQFGAGELPVVLDCFITDTFKRLDRIERAVAADDLAKIAREAHDLTSLLGSFGFPGLMNRAARIEGIAGTGGSPTFVPDTRTLLADIRGALTEMRRRFPIAPDPLRDGVDLVGG